MKTIFRAFCELLKQTIKDFKYNCKHIIIHSKDTNEKNYALLRTCCHILDKGMNNVNFEKGHSLRYLIEAKRLRNEMFPIYHNDVCFSWIDEIINRFEKAQEIGYPQLKNRQPIEYTKSEIDEYTSFLLNRTSCRNFIKKKIDHSVIDEIVKIAIDAPNGCCRQVVRYYLTQDEEKISKSIPHIAGITNFSNVQCLVCVAAEISCYNIIDKNLQYVDAALSAENFILGASLYGVYGTMCNFFQASVDDVAQCKELFNVAPSEEIVMFMVIGYPSVIPEKPARRNTDSFYKII